MEPLDSNYVVQQRANPRARFNWLLIIPALGALWLVYLLLAAVFQWSISDVVENILGLMILGFFIFVGLLFYALAPRANR